MMGRRILFDTPSGVKQVIPDPRFDWPDTIDAVAVEAIANAGLGPTPYVIVYEADLPPRRWRAAWKLVAGMPVVDLVEARKVRKAELLAAKIKAVERVRQRIEDAEENGQAARVNALRDKRKTLRGLDAALDGQLAGVADLAALGTFLPAILADPDAQ